MIRVQSEIKNSRCIFGRVVLFCLNTLRRSVHVGSNPSETKKKKCKFCSGIELATSPTVVTAQWTCFQLGQHTTWILNEAPSELWAPFFLTLSRTLKKMKRTKLKLLLSLVVACVTEFWPLNKTFGPPRIFWPPPNVLHTLKSAILNIEISNDDSWTGSPPSNSNSDNASISQEWNFGKFEFNSKFPNSAQTRGWNTYHYIQRSFCWKIIASEALKTNIVKCNRSWRLLVLIFDWEVRHHAAAVTVIILCLIDLNAWFQCYLSLQCSDI